MLLGLTMKTSWICLIFVLHTSNSSLDCGICDDCLCVHSPSKCDFRCPDPRKEEYDEIIKTHVTFEENSKREIEMNVDCHFSPIFEETFLPNLTLRAVDRLHIMSCALPESNFKQIVNIYSPSVLKELEFTHSNLWNITLTKGYFEGFEDLEIMSLNDNNLEEIEENVFENCPKLVSLNFQGNRLKLTGDFFKYTPLLKSLCLADNNLSQIPVKVFESLENLQHLDLRGNILTTVNEQTFGRLFRLSSLELRANQINFLADNAFHNLTNLKQINLSLNKIKILPENLFVKNKNLDMISLRDNIEKLVLPESCFANLPLLETIDLTNTRINTIPHNLFQNSINLTNISLANTSLSILPPTLFANLANLEILDLSQNRILEISYIFDSLKKLKKLLLPHNQIEEIGRNALPDLSGIEEIDLGYNQIRKIDDLAFDHKPKLKTIDLSHNFYREEGDFKILENAVNVEVINLSHNLISRFDRVVNLGNKAKLKFLDLGNNHIRRLDMRDLVSISPDLQISLEENSISRINLNLPEIFQQSDLSNQTKVYLNNNPIDCCFIFDFIQNFRKLKKFDFHIDKLFCAGPPKLRDMLVEQLSASQIECSLEDLVYGRSGCPDNCTCDWSPYTKSIMVNCTRKNWNEYPELNFTLLPEFSFHQIEVHLEGNNLVAGPSPDLAGYGNVTKLYLSDNKIKNIFWIPDRIEILALDNNSLSRIDNPSLERLNAINFTYLVLGNNPWACNCEAYHFVTFLKQHLGQFDEGTTFCANSQISLIEMDWNELCQVWLIVCIVLLVTTILFLAAVATAVYYRYRETIDAWLYNKGWCQCLCPPGQENEDKIYDAFISYSHIDEEFVTQTLLPVLESAPNSFKIAVHFRDFIPGEFICEQVTNTVLNSRRTIVVLSPNFLESVWGKMEFRTAHTQAMNDKQTRVILILYGDIDAKKLDPELELYTKTNTYVKWGDPYFWTKLLYALPHKNQNLKEERKLAKMRRFRNNFLPVDLNKSKPDLLEDAPSIGVTTPSPESRSLLTTAPTFQ